MPRYGTLWIYESRSSEWHHGPIDYESAFRGGQLTDLNLDVERGTVSFTVRVLDGGRYSVYDVILSHVTDLRIKNEIEVPWNYSDIAYFQRTETDTTVQVEIVLWDEPTGIKAVCGDIIATKL